MIQHIWTIPCRHVITDRENNALSLIATLEEVTLLGIPFQVPVTPGQPPVVPPIATFYVVSSWWRQNDDQPVRGTGRLSLMSPAGEVLVTQEYEIDLFNNPRLRTTCRFLGFPQLPESGRFTFRVEYRVAEGEWQEAARVPLRVNLPPAMTASSATPATSSASAAAQG